MNSLKNKYSLLCRNTDDMKNELEKLNGCIAYKTINDRKYVYIQKMYDGKMSYKYVGPVGSIKAEKIIQLYTKKKTIKQKIKRQKTEIKILRHTICIKKLEEGI